MEFENTESVDKNEFVALGTTVKQEMIDNGITDDTAAEPMAETSAGSNEINSATTASNTPDAMETSNPVCDSVEKQVWTKSNGAIKICIWFLLWIVFAFHSMKSSIKDCKLFPP